MYAGAISDDVRNAAREVAPYSLTRHWLIGSYARGTAIRKYSDLDFMFEFHGATNIERVGSRPLLTAIKDCLDRSAGTAVRVSEMQEVVQIEYRDGIHLDILPAVRCDSQGYLIPDGRNGWQPTNPVIQEYYFKRQDDASRIQLPEFTRGMKYWNAAHGGLLHSYHLESMVAQLAPQLNENYAVASFETFEEISRTVSISDPAGCQGELSVYLSTSQRNAISALCRTAASGAFSALKAQVKGDQDAAVSTWASVYGPLFPSKVS